LELIWTRSSGNSGPSPLKLVAAPPRLPPPAPAVEPAVAARDAAGVDTSRDGYICLFASSRR